MTMVARNVRKKLLPVAIARLFRLTVPSNVMTLRMTAHLSTPNTPVAERLGVHLQKRFDPPEKASTVGELT